MNQKTLDALASAIYVSRQSLAGAAIETDDQRLRAAGLYPDWAPGVHGVGEICNTHADGTLGNEWDQTWEVFQAYDNAVYPDVAPGGAAWYTFHRPLHGTAPETARPFVPVQGAHDIYRPGECMLWTDGAVYRCLRETSFGPADDPAAWEAV